jgi:hypothetical protein
MKELILKLAGVSSEEEFYSLYPTQESFFEKNPEAVEIINNYKQSQGIESMANGGLMGNKVPIQAETYQGQPEQVVLPDGTVDSVNAQTSHENMSDDKVTDILPEGSHIQSARNKLTPEQYEQLLSMFDPKGAENNKKLLDQVSKGKNKKISPAEISEYAKKNYQKESTPNSFDTDKLKESNKKSFIDLSMNLNDLIKAGKELSEGILPTEVMAWGGPIGKYAEGDKVIDYNNISISNLEDLKKYLNQFGIDPETNLPNYKFKDLENTKKRYIDLANQVNDKELVSKLKNLQGSSEKQFEELKKAAGKLQNFHKLNNPKLSLDFTLDTKDTRTSLPTVIKYGKELGLSENEISLLSKNKNKGYHSQPKNIQNILDKANEQLPLTSPEIQNEFVNTRFVDNEAYYRMPEKFQFNFGDISNPNSPQSQAYKYYLENFYQSEPVQNNLVKNSYGKYSAPIGYTTMPVDNIEDWKKSNNVESSFNPGTFSNPGSGLGNISFKPILENANTPENVLPKVDNLSLGNPQSIVAPQNNPMTRFNSGLLESQLNRGLQGNQAYLNAAMDLSPVYTMETPDTFIRSRRNEIPVGNILYNIEKAQRDSANALAAQTGDWSTLASNIANSGANAYNQIGDTLSALNEKNVGLYNTTQDLQQNLLSSNVGVRNQNLTNMQNMMNYKRNLMGQKAVKDAELYSNYSKSISENAQKEQNQKMELLNVMASKPDMFKGERGQQFANQIMGNYGSYNNPFSGSVLDFGINFFNKIN